MDVQNDSFNAEWEECLQSLGRHSKGSKINDEDSYNDDSVSEVDELPTKEHLLVLLKYFRHSSFRPQQWEIIRSILRDRRDNCVIMAAGSGKSLIYQYPSVFTRGLSIVISPFVPLMQDQVSCLRTANIPAEYISVKREMSRVLKEVFVGKLRVLYVTPEICVKSNFLQDLAKKMTITLVAVDEAHFVSQWGHHFHRGCRKLGALRQSLPNIPFLAVTATASSAVRKDICTSLCLVNPNVVCASLDKPNLFFSASLKSNDIYNDLRKFMVGSVTRAMKFDGKTIVYCQTWRSTEDVYYVLKDNHFPCGFYHSQRKLADRTEAYEKFMKDELDVIVATAVLGVGIDKHDVRNVIHYGAPKDIESFYQQIGRAGRDGHPAKCHVFYSHSDLKVNYHFPRSLCEPFLGHRQKMVKLMEHFLKRTVCRRQILLMSFEGKGFVKKTEKSCCDNCHTALKESDTLAMQRPRPTHNDIMNWIMTSYMYQTATRKD